MSQGERERAREREEEEEEEEEEGREINLSAYKALHASRFGCCACRIVFSRSES